MKIQQRYFSYFSIFKRVLNKKQIKNQAKSTQKTTKTKHYPKKLGGISKILKIKPKHKTKSTNPKKQFHKNKIPTKINLQNSKEQSSTKDSISHFDNKKSLFKTEQAS
ncbi:hypothetical protein [Flavobacterium sp. 2]|uniref:hypothetical protein n=1 Tax=Flavobacterium sp. 2 TaxID=308053 RepID=UPI003CF6B903